MSALWLILQLPPFPLPGLSEIPKPPRTAFLSKTAHRWLARGGVERSLRTGEGLWEQDVHPEQSPHSSAPSYHSYPFWAFSTFLPLLWVIPLPFFSSFPVQVSENLKSLWISQSDWHYKHWPFCINFVVILILLMQVTIV